MKHDDLIEFLARSATELVHDAEALDEEGRRRALDEAAELLFLGAGLLRRRETGALRKAA